MKRFLSTTAVVLAMTGTAVYADAHANKFGSIAAEQSDFYASDLIGMRIYNSETEMDASMRIADGAEREWDDIGEINDIIVSADGNVRAVILGVGGFLGIGEKDVAVSMDDITILTEEGDAGDRFLVVNTSTEMLENAPAYERRMNVTEAEEVETAETTTTTEETTTAMSSTSAENKEEVQEVTLTRPTMQRDGYQEAKLADLQQIAADQIEGSYVYGANDETVGEIDALLMNADGQIQEAVINVGGFLGLGEKPVAVSFDQIQVLRSEDGGELRFYIDSTEEKLEAMPRYEN